MTYDVGRSKHLVGHLSQTSQVPLLKLSPINIKDVTSPTIKVSSVRSTVESSTLPLFAIIFNYNGH